MEGHGGSALLTDLYQLNMMQAYLEAGETGTAVFELFVRRLPDCRGFLMAAGLAQAITFLETLQFAPDEIEWLKRSDRFSPDFIEYLAGFRFTGDVDAMAEGTVFFADEPILRVTAPLPEAQLLESRLINILNFQTMIASKATRMRVAAPDKTLVDFGFRRAHGAEAGVMAARASYIAGFDGTATVLAGRLFGLPLYGTMAHSLVEAFDSEAVAFEAFARARPDGLILLIDTYDSEAGARKVVELAPRLRADGIVVRGVRLDSGDLVSMSRRVRAILDAGGLPEAIIFASGGLDEESLLRFAAAEAPIDGYGLGTALTTSLDAAALDSVYKLQEYDGTPRRKKSEGKATWPGRKQVWRRYDAAGHMTGDTVGLAGEDRAGTSLLAPVMAAGRRLAEMPSMAAMREHAARNLAALPEALRRLEPGARYSVTVTEALVNLAAAVDDRLEEVEDAT